MHVAHWWICAHFKGCFSLVRLHPWFVYAKFHHASFIACCMSVWSSSCAQLRTLASLEMNQKPNDQENMQSTQRFTDAAKRLPQDRHLLENRVNVHSPLYFTCAADMYVYYCYAFDQCVCDSLANKISA